MSSPRDSSLVDVCQEAEVDSLAIVQEVNVLILYLVALLLAVVALLLWDVDRRSLGGLDLLGRLRLSSLGRRRLTAGRASRRGRLALLGRIRSRLERAIDKKCVRQRAYGDGRELERKPARGELEGGKSCSGRTATLNSFFLPFLSLFFGMALPFAIVSEQSTV